MRKLIATSTMLVLGSTGSVVLAPPGTAADAGTTARTQPTAFALQTSGFGTRVRGGQVPAGSDDTAYTVIACTNKAGLTRQNHVAEETLPGVGKASEITTKVWTTQSRKGVVTSRSRNSVARVVLADSPLGSLSIDGLRSVSKAWHDSSGFHSSTKTSIGSITLTPAAGDPQQLDLPTPDQPLEVPGLATISLGKSHKSAGSGGAKATAEVLRIDVTASGSRARIGHTYAEIDGGVKSGIFGGFASGLRANAADSNITTGRTPYQPMPCQGTGGETEVSSTAAVDLGGQIVVGAVESRQRAEQTRKRAGGFEQGRVASIDIGDGALVVKGIVGRVNVHRTGDHLHKLVRNIKGTTIGSITADGEPQTFPDTGVLEIPGVARLESSIKHKIKGGMAVTALRITLLDGTGATINLGQAKLFVKPSGR
ncbi:choice-of-anchor P family protein [Nocardioides sp. MAHUQ-72]|uniref:choice-of-anchor P family protein n=1 Tax=unclassified Nocardioides TaxID=2615069 RepID=UPI00361D6FA4